MPGALAQLQLLGAADQILTGTPQVTFFRQKIHRHSNFAIEDSECVWSGPATFGSKTTVIIPRQGDLLHQLWLQVELPHVDDFDGTGYNSANVAYCNNVGHALLQRVEVEIGGVRMDSHTGDYMDIWSELTTKSEKRPALFEQCLGKFDEYDPSDSRKSFKGGMLYIPLQFWFCRSIGLSLPILALKFHDVRINCEFREFRDLLRTKTGTLLASNINTKETGRPPTMDARMYAQFIYVDVPERKRIAAQAQEYLIEVTQFLGDNFVDDKGLNRKLNVTFSHPVKELLFVYSSLTSLPSYTATSDTIDHFDYGLPSYSTFKKYTDPSYPGYVFTDYFSDPIRDPTSDQWKPWDNVTEDPVEQARLVMNGHERIAFRPGKWYRLVQTYMHHTSMPKTPQKKIYVYSFALDPESPSPTGSANFSRYDTATLDITFHRGIMQGRVRIYARSYNLLRIENGMAGLAFAS